MFRKRRFVSFNSINIIFVSYVMIAALVLRGHSPKRNCVRIVDACLCSLVVHFLFLLIVYVIDYTLSSAVFTLMFKHSREVTGTHTFIYI